jgi:enoyl reductase
MSKAIVFDEYGGPDVLRLIDAPPPVPGDGQVLVRVRAAGVQPADALFRSGAMRDFAPATFPQRLGNEFAGTIESTGQNILGWAPQSCYAQHAVVDPDAHVSKPDAIPWSHAGVLSASGQTASSALEQLRVSAGETVLIHAAAGGVGSFAVQLAAAAGARVIGTASPRNHDYLRSLGATPVSYGDGLLDRLRDAAPAGVDAALDGSGQAEALEASLALVSNHERVGAIAYSPAVFELGVRRLSSQRSTARLQQLVDLYQAGKLKVSIQQEFPLDEAVQAHRVLATGHVRGKLVILP